MKSAKTKAIDLILLGLTMQFIPLIVLGGVAKTIRELGSQPAFIVSFITLIFFISGYVLVVKGCFAYAKSKGYSKLLGWIGLLNLIGLAFLLIIPIKEDRTSTDAIRSEFPEADNFQEINVPEILLLVSFSLPFLLVVAIWIYCLLNGLILLKTLKSVEIELLGGIVIGLFIILILLKIAQRNNLSLYAFFGHINNIRFKLAILVAFSLIIFSIGFDNLTLYNISYVAPGYVQDLLNKKHLSKLPELILNFISGVFWAPFVEEIIFRGIALQKWMLKWGVKWGVILSSLLFAVCHFRYDVIPLFLIGVSFSLLYLRTSNLFSSILCHTTFNSIILGSNIVSFFSKSIKEREKVISVTEIQESLHAHMDIYIALAIIGALLLIYLLYKLRPNDNVIIPYLRNKDLKRQTEIF